MGANADVLTLGYENQSLDDVLEALTEHEVDRLVDVRAINESTQEGFSGDELASALGHNDISYTHLGQLGDFQPEPYPTYMDTQAWEAAFETLLETVENDRAALLCTCADVSSCHRRYLAQKLREHGLNVVHLTPAGPKQAVTFETEA